MTRRLAILAAAVALLGACERRVEEPGARSSKRSASAPAATSASAAASASASVSAARCIEPTPKEPERPAPSKGPHPDCPDDPDERPKLGRATLEVEGKDARLQVEVARDDAHRMRGLMYRKELPEDGGMLFVFERPAVQRFWMKNTCIPLDMLFLDHDGLVVGIEENVPPMNLRSYFVRCRSLYVLEVNAGWSRRHGVEAGDEIRIEGL